MDISEKEIEMFQRLYFEIFKKNIDSQQALEEGGKLLNLLEIIHKPISICDITKLSNKPQ